MVLFRGPDFIFEMVNAKYSEIISDQNVIGKTLMEVFPASINLHFLSVIKRVYETGEYNQLSDGFDSMFNSNTGQIDDRCFDTTFSRISDGNDKPYLVVGHAMDVSDRIRTQKNLSFAIHLISTLFLLTTFGRSPVF